MLPYLICSAITKLHIDRRDFDAKLSVRPSVTTMTECSITFLESAVMICALSVAIIMAHVDIRLLNILRNLTKCSQRTTTRRLKYLLT